jgi:hypothetical protein
MRIPSLRKIRKQASAYAKTSTDMPPELLSSFENANKELTEHYKAWTDALTLDLSRPPLSVFDRTQRYLKHVWDTKTKTDRLAEIVKQMNRLRSLVENEKYRELLKAREAKMRYKTVRKFL